MKVAIIGHGKQWKKHWNAWKKYGIIPDFFSKYWSSGVGIFSNVDSWKLSSFDCIVIAVSPISEQERVIQKILSLQYFGLLIIEKPICEDLDLLLALKKRENTIFFIDEVFLVDWILDIKIIDHFDIYSVDISDFSNVLEHALWCFLTQPNFWKLLSLPVNYHLSHYTFYKIYWINNYANPLIDAELWDFSWITNKPFRFDTIYKELLLKSRNSQWLKMVRYNYYTFRLALKLWNK